MSDYSASSVTDLLFVYGTLMQGNRNEFAIHLHHHSTYLGKGWFPGCLYQINWFPGAIYDSSAPTRVWGEVYQLHASAKLLPYLDAYEGVDDNPPMYIRRMLPVNLANQVLACHTYLYNLSTDDLVLLSSGQFRSFT